MTFVIPTRPSPESERLLKRAGFVRRAQEKAQPHGLSLFNNRLIMNVFALRARAPKGGSARWVDHGVRGRLVTTRDADPANGILLWIHGGGLVSGNPRLEQELAAAVTSGFPAFLPRYRLAPEHPFPAAADDVLAAYRALLDQGFPATKIRVGGMSAGGALTAGLLGDIVRTGLPVPAAVLLVSPMLQMSAALARQRDEAHPDPMSSPQFIERVNKAYTQDTPLTDSRLDHLAADVSAWPRTLIQVGGTECLVAESEFLGERLRTAGVHCEVQVWPGQVHGFPAIGADKVPEAVAARDYARTFLAARDE
jgi:acetyl esterase/lipase